jgi:ABC-2 type transport system ATP-binding protein
VDLHIDAAAVRSGLMRGLVESVTRLAELASRHANDRELVFRAVLLKRDLARADGSPTTAYFDRGIAILDDLVADQAAAAASGKVRSALAETARARCMEIPVPHEVACECIDLTKRYRRGDFELDKISLEVRYGEIVGVVGRNGNGKTTLFRLVVGELRPDAGVLHFPAMQSRAARLRWSRVRPQIGYVPQEIPRWYGSLKSNLHYEAAIHGILGTDNEREVDFIVERLGLTNELGKRWHELAGGFKLRFALAKALVWKPKLLVLDEPLANLDVLAQQVVLSDLRHLADSLRYPLGILVSSQHVHEVEEVSDKLLMLGEGKAKYWGPVGEIGDARRANSFELTGNIELADLEAVFKGPEYHSIYYNGVAFVVTTDRSVTAPMMLRRLLERDVPITYFRDISRSAKSLIQTDGMEL